MSDPDRDRVVQAIAQARMLATPPQGMWTREKADHATAAASHALDIAAMYFEKDQARIADLEKRVEVAETGGTHHMQTSDELRKQVKALIHEKDSAIDREDRMKAERDELVETVTLYTQTNGLIPLIGLLCDGEFCIQAVGVVGPKIVDLDKIAPHCIAIALAGGWSVQEVEVETANLMITTKAVHYCPQCTKDLK